MERISEFKRVIRTLYQVSWMLLGIIIVNTAIYHNLESAWAAYALAITYAVYLYYHMKRCKMNTTGLFIAEILLILLLDWVARVPLVAYLFTLLIIRRATYSRDPNIYLEAVVIGVLYLVCQRFNNPYIYDGPWIYTMYNVLIIGLTALLAQPVARFTNILQVDREKLRLKLNKVEASYQQAAELALRDGLTGLYNYRALQQHITGISDNSFAILLIDVDHFKDFNDRYGHIVGDQVLAQTGQVILENVRRSDKVYRYGGEEFAVVLEDITDEVAMFTAERIRSRVANQALECGGQTLKSITISLGVALFDEPKLSTHQILVQADKALYEAKARGRNNVVFFAEPNMST